MMNLQKKAQARTRQIVGQMIGDDQLVMEGKEEERRANSKDLGEPRQNEQKNGQEEEK